MISGKAFCFRSSPDGFLESSPVSALLSVTTTSRQIWSETRLLPLRLFDLRIGDILSDAFDLNVYTQLLSAEQKGAIRSLRVEVPEVPTSEKFWYPLKALKGLQKLKVIVWGNRVSESDKKTILEQLHGCVPVEPHVEVTVVPLEKGFWRESH